MKPRLHALLLLLIPTLGFANGGGYRYGAKFTGSVAPFQPEGTENVQIVEENLDITLGQDAASVSVRYLMRNLADKSTTVRFGFPVEVINHEGMDVLDDNAGEIDPRSGNPLKKRGTEKVTNQYCGDYIATADGKTIAHQYQAEPFSEGKIKAFPGSDALHGIQGWMVSEVTFEKGQEREITINYTSDYDIAALFVSEDHYQNPATFRYRLSTGGVWGGPIAKGTVTIHAEGIPQEEVTIKKPAGRFRIAGNTWKWEFKDLEPTLAEDIIIDAIPGWTEFRRREGDKWIGYIERLGVWAKSHQDFTATASSSLKPHKSITYGPENISNQDWGDDDETDPHRAWVEGADGDGIGEFIEITPSNPAPLLGFSIRNGYTKSEEIFDKNNRVKTLTVTLNGEHSFDATLKDNDEFQNVFIRRYNKPVGKVRLTIKDVYRGSKYRDTCISNVELATRLAKKPEVHGAR